MQSLKTTYPSDDLERLNQTNLINQKNNLAKNKSQNSSFLQFFQQLISNIGTFFSSIAERFSNWYQQFKTGNKKATVIKNNELNQNGKKVTSKVNEVITGKSNKKNNSGSSSNPSSNPLNLNPSSTPNNSAPTPTIPNPTLSPKGQTKIEIPNQPTQKPTGSTQNTHANNLSKPFPTSNKGKIKQEKPTFLSPQEVLRGLKKVEDQLSAPLSEFIEKARQDISTLSFDELDEGLMLAWEESENIKHPINKTTIFEVAKVLSEKYIKAKNFDSALNIRIRTATFFSPENPLSNLQDQLKNAHPILGLRLQPLGTNELNNQTLTVQKRTYDIEDIDGNITGNKNLLFVDMQLNTCARQSLQRLLDFLNEDVGRQILLSYLPKEFCKGIQLTEEEPLYHGRKHEVNENINNENNKNWRGNFSDKLKHGRELPMLSFGKYTNYVLNLEGIGKIRVGSTPSLVTEYNYLSIELDASISESQAVQKLHLIFAVLGLGTLSSVSRPEDRERVKIMQIFKTLEPEKSHTFKENNEQLVFQGSSTKLRNKIEADIPGMKEQFDFYLDSNHPERMVEEEILPGQFVWRMKGLKEKVRAAGGLGLMSCVFSGFCGRDEAYRRVVNIMKIGGSLSTQDRLRLGINATGNSFNRDLEAGGTDASYVRMMTEKMSMDPRDYRLQGPINILYDLDAIEMANYYCYLEDNFGSKQLNYYPFRHSIVNFVNQIQNNPKKCNNNEVCFNHAIPSKFIKRFIVAGIEEKQDLIQAIRDDKDNLIEINEQGIETWNKIPLDELIQVGPFQPKHWK